MELAGLSSLTRYTPERLSKVWLILKEFTHKIWLILGEFYLKGSELGLSLEEDEDSFVVPYSSFHQFYGVLVLHLKTQSNKEL